MKLLTHTQSVDAILKKISSEYKQNKKFCDLGCGSGYRTMLFNEYNRDVTGIDIRDYRFPENKKFSFIHGDIFKSNLPANTYDMVFSYDVIEHLEKPELLLKEIHRILKPEGICVLATPNRYRIVNAVLLLLGKRKYPYCINEKYVNEYPEYWHITEFSYAQLKKLLNDNGFAISKHYKIFYGLPGKLGLKELFGLPLYHNHIMILKKN